MPSRLDTHWYNITTRYKNKNHLFSRGNNLPVQPNEAFMLRFAKRINRKMFYAHRIACGITKTKRIRYFASANAFMHKAPDNFLWLITLVDFWQKVNHLTLWVPPTCYMISWGNCAPIGFGIRCEQSARQWGLFTSVTNRMGQVLQMIMSPVCHNT